MVVDNLAFLMDQTAWASTPVSQSTLLLSDSTASNIADQIEVYASKIIISRLLAENITSYGVDGTVMNLDNGSTAYLSDSIIRNVNSSGHGGGIAVQSGSILVASNTLFEGLSAEQGGALFATQTSMLRLKNVTFHNNFATTFGGAGYADESSLVLWNQGACMGCSAGSRGGCFRIQNYSGLSGASGSSHEFIGISFTNLTSGKGAVFDLEGSVTVSLQQSEIESAFATDQGGSFFISDGASLTLNYSTVYDSSSSMGGLAFVEVNSLLTISNTSISFCNATRSNGGTLAIVDSTLAFLSSNISNSESAANGGAFYIDRSDFGSATMHAVLIRDARFQNLHSAVDGGVLYVTNGAAVTLENTKTYISAAGNGGCFASVITSSTITGTSTLTLLNNNLLWSCFSLSSHGALYVSGPSRINITGRDDTVLTASSSGSPNNLGGFLYVEGSPIIDISQSIRVQNMYCDRNAIIYLGGCPSIMVHSTNTSSPKFIHDQDDKIYIDDLQCALDVLPYYPGWESFVGNISATHIGPPAQLQKTVSSWEPPASGVRIAETLGAITVQAADIFGNTAGCMSMGFWEIIQATSWSMSATNGDANIGSPIVVWIREINHGTPIYGEYIKAILNFSTNSVTFTGLSLAAHENGQYRLSIEAVSGIAVHLPWPQILVTVEPCSQDGSQTWSQNYEKCLPIASVQPAVEIATVAVSSLLAGICLATIALIYRFRSFQVVKRSSPIFLAIINVGGILFFGFLSVFLALILRTYRIHAIFSGGAKLQVVVITDSKLGTYFVAFAVPFLIFLVIWTILAPPRFQLVENFDYATSRNCTSPGPFQQIRLIIQLIFEAVAVVLGYLVRNVNTCFNESKLIAFTCYNWVIFGAILTLLRPAVSDPTFGYLIGSIAIVLPHTITIIALVVIKLRLCIVAPDTASRSENANLIEWPSLLSDAMKSSPHLDAFAGLQSPKGQGPTTNDGADQGNQNAANRCSRRSAEPFETAYEGHIPSNGQV
ncbi:uncharacterized protein BJ171DRAFT_569888 [Polychytrium aggregatum]|uniref:uncharacterized protein n=1 Tax=Polychytrium aggregatum TaxID=110093 RepID=UPI0022FE0D43|nr:uncharacterized protein BJ171DRAFT_569888 [Polychytrium aggregatum]KAI9202263.1 hypothetical protein BJ171DRAFT_569888 [Polychytrium aggregatum]